MKCHKDKYVMHARKLIHGNQDIYAGFKPIELDLQGWASDSPVFDFTIEKIRPKTIVEVGSWKGRSAINMAKSCRRLGLDTEIICVDTWLGSVEHWQDIGSIKPMNGRSTLYDQFISNVIHCGFTDCITPLPVDSINGYLILQSHGVQADLIYIDGGHDYDSVKTDLTNYSQLIKKGGIIIGDDWFHLPIRKAVADTLGQVETFSGDKFIWTA